MTEQLQLAVQESKNIIQKYADKLEPEQLEVLPLLGGGMSPSAVSKATKIQQSRITKWLSTDPVFTSALSEFRGHIEDYHRAMLDQVGALAWTRAIEYLSEPATYDDLSKAKVQSSIVKFIISQLGLRIQRHKIEASYDINATQLHMTNDSAAIIAQKLKELQDSGDIVDSEYRIVMENLPSSQDRLSGMGVARSLDELDDKDFDAELNELKSSQPQQYVMHPECKFGALDYDEQKKKFRCHICGDWSRDLVVHIRTKHKLSPARYRNMYGLSKDVKFYIETPTDPTDEDMEEID